MASAHSGVLGVPSRVPSLAARQNATGLVKSLLEEIPVDGLTPGQKRTMDEVLR